MPTDPAVPGMASAMLPVLLAALAAFALICVLASHFRFEAMLREASTAGGTRALAAAIAERIGTGFRKPASFCAILAQPVLPREAPSPLREGIAHDLETLVRERIAVSVRRGDRVLPLGGERFAMLLEVPHPVAAHVARRVEEMEAMEGLGRRGGARVRVRLGCGIAEYPRDGKTTQALIGAAQEALRASVERGESPAAPESSDGGVAAAARGSRLAVLEGAEWSQAFGGFVARARRGRRHASVVAIDIERLQRYNDQYGRGAGDAILRSVRYFVGQNIRQGDLAGADGADGFFVAMNSPSEGALLAGQRLVEGARKMMIEAGGVSLRINVSGGVAGSGESGHDPAALMRNALAALQDAKARSRGTCALYDGRRAVPATQSLSRS
jgi:diguanylate cyclase (GGDEF)-like protein